MIKRYAAILLTMVWADAARAQVATLAAPDCATTSNSVRVPSMGNGDIRCGPSYIYATATGSGSNDILFAGKRVYEYELYDFGITGAPRPINFSYRFDVAVQNDNEANEGIAGGGINVYDESGQVVLTDSFTYFYNRSPRGTGLGLHSKSLTVLTNKKYRVELTARANVQSGVGTLSMLAYSDPSITFDTSLYPQTTLLLSDGIDNVVRPPPGLESPTSDGPIPPWGLVALGVSLVAIARKARGDKRLWRLTVGS